MNVKRPAAITITKLSMVSCLFLGILFCSVSYAQAPEKEVIPSVCVEGIIYDSQNPYAIVNGVPVRTGDNVKGVIITKITDSLVTFQYNANNFSKGVGEKCNREVLKPKKEEAVQQPKQRLTVTPQESAFTTSVQRRAGFDKHVRIDTHRVEALVKSMHKTLLIVLLLLYCYMSFVVQKIAHKTETENAWLAWIPLANLFLLCSIADKPFFWILVIFVPFVGAIIFTIIIWGGVAQACGRASWLGILMLLPLVNFVVVTYLAFSTIKPLVIEDKPLPPDPLQHIAHPTQNPNDTR
jgi:hypothetical protein